MESLRIQKRLIRISYLVILTVILFLHEGVNAQEPDFVWVKNADGPGLEYGDAVATDASGNIYVTGYFDGTVTFGTTELTTSGGFDIFVVKYDASGNVVWAGRAGGVSGDKGLSIATDGWGNVYITGHFSGTATFGMIQLTAAGSDDIFVVKYNDTGNVVWAKGAGDTYYDWGQDVVTDKWGNVIVTGYFHNTVTFGTYTLTSYNHSDIFITKFDPDGNVLWAERAGGNDRDSGTGITTDGSGNIYIIGDFEESAIFGTTVLNSIELEDIFIAKYNGSGNVVWARQIGGTSGDYGSAIATDGSGNIYVTGHFSGTATFGATELNCAGYEDIFVAKYNASGNVEWVEQAGGTADDGCRKRDGGYGIATDESGNSYVTGSFAGTVSFDTTPLTCAGESDIFITKYNTFGNVLWDKQAGGTGYDEGGDIAIDGSGNITVTGVFTESATFGTTTLSGHNEDIFVAKLTEAPPAPTDLVALNGYNSAVPLAWKAPDGTNVYSAFSPAPFGGQDNVSLRARAEVDVYSQSVSMTLQGYNVYRSSSPGGPYVEIANQVSSQYYRDENVVDGNIYYYVVTAVYDAGESDYSNEISGQAQTNGYSITSGWSSSVPTINGVIATGEWFEASTASMTYPGYTGMVTLYVMNDKDYLYMAVDDQRDNSLDNSDTFGILFDDNGNREWPFSATGEEGILQLSWSSGSPSAGYSGFYGWWPSNVHGEDWITPDGIQHEISASSGNVQYEARFDLSTSPLNPSPGDIMGILVYTWDGSVSDFSGLWPQETVTKLASMTSGYGWAHGPFSFGDIILSQGIAAGTLVAWGDNSDNQCDVPAGTDYTQVSAGWHHGVTMQSDGSLSAWGKNDWGQCNVPGGTYYTQVVAGDFHSVALKSDGSLVAWGNNTYGQINVPAGTDYTRITAGGYHSVALRSDGSLVAWGKNDEGQCNVPSGTDYIQVSAGAYHSVALKSDGSLVAWGLNLYGRCDAPAGIDYAQVAAGGSHSLALRSDGSLVAWGRNYDGECDVPSGTDYIQVSAGGWYSVALRSDGSLVAWGDNTNGECDVPSGTGYFQISAARVHTLALRTAETDVEIGFQHGSDSHPEDYALFQNYPNPFNPLTMIRFEVYRPGFVEIKVYDLTGREIETLVSGYHEVNQYEVVWDAGNLPSGIYLYRLVAGDHVDTRKLILQK